MPLLPDDTVCYCFHVSVRKVATFCRVQKPRVPSQISECLSAGTGCGWCVPLLKRIHAEQTGKSVAGERRPAEPTSADIDDAAAYAEARRLYLDRKKAT